jgi:hypothetical protein
MPLKTSGRHIISAFKQLSSNKTPNFTLKLNIGDGGYVEYIFDNL